MESWNWYCILRLQGEIPCLFHKSLSFEEMEVEAMEIDSGNTMK